MFLRWKCFCLLFCLELGKDHNKHRFYFTEHYPYHSHARTSGIRKSNTSVMYDKLHTLFISKLQIFMIQCLWLPWWLNGKESTCNVGDAGLIFGSERSPGEGNGNPLQYSSLGNAMDRGAWRATAHEVTKEPNMT